jgi:hypothetical protein
MAATFDPNPPSRKDEDFPKTNTVPEGWVSDALMQKYNGMPVPDTGTRPENTRPAPQVEDESVFTRRMDPFPKTNTVPSGWDVSAM